MGSLDGLAFGALYALQSLARFVARYVPREFSRIDSAPSPLVLVVYRSHPGSLVAVIGSLVVVIVAVIKVFRTNTSYQRWDEARKNWGMNINHTRDLVRMGTSFYDNAAVSSEQRAKDLKALSLATWSFVRAMKRHLSPESEDEQDFRRELFERLPAPQAQAIIDAAHRPNRALFDLSVAIENLPMHFLRKNQVHQAVTIFEDNLGSSERLLTSPVPLFYSRHTARFLSFWLLLLPFALWDPFAGTWNHVGMIPATAVISIFLFGIEELATQMEEPFTILPMQAFCDKIGNWCNEIVSWQAGDNGMAVNMPSMISPEGLPELKEPAPVPAMAVASVAAAMPVMANGDINGDTTGITMDQPHNAIP